MQVVTPDLIKDKKVILRLDIDVPLRLRSGSSTSYEVVDDFRLVAGMPTLELCLENATQTIIMGHIGRPTFAEASAGKPDEESLSNLNVGPIYDWLVNHGFEDEFDSGKLQLLENLRFEKGENEADLAYAQKLADLGNFYVNEAFASHHEAASTTILPKYLPHAAGLRFFREVEILREVRENPKKPLVVIIGGVKVEDKLPAALALAKIADYVLIGGKIAAELKRYCNSGSCQSPAPSDVLTDVAGGRWGTPAPVTPHLLPDVLSENILLAELNEEGVDITAETIEKWAPTIADAKMILWNGPMGRIEGQVSSIKYKGEENLGSAKGTYKIAQLIINSKAETIVGGGDTVGFLGRLGLLGRFGWVSTGGGAMLEFLETGTLPTIEALK